MKDLAHGKAGKVKVSKPPQFVEIVDSIKMLMDQGDAIAPATLAKLLKFKLLMIKQKDHEKREEERKVDIGTFFVSIFNCHPIYIIPVSFHIGLTFCSYGNVPIRCSSYRFSVFT